MKVKGRRQSKNVSYVGKTSGKQGRNVYSLGAVTKFPEMGAKVGLNKMTDALRRDAISNYKKRTGKK